MDIDQVELSQNRVQSRLKRGGLGLPPSLSWAASEGLQARSTISESGEIFREKAKATAFEHEATSSQYAQYLSGGADKQELCCKGAGLDTRSSQHPVLAKTSNLTNY